jgi:hypothetical protein
VSKYILIIAIITSVVSQNTCPQGWAAKTAFATCGAVKQTTHCPMHEKKQPQKDVQDDVKHGISNVKQAFVIHIAGPDNSYQILEHTSNSLPIKSFALTEIFSDPILRPPIPSLFS